MCVEVKALSGVMVFIPLSPEQSVRNKAEARVCWVFTLSRDVETFREDMTIIFYFLLSNRRFHVVPLIEATPLKLMMQYHSKHIFQNS